MAAIQISALGLGVAHAAEQGGPKNSETAPVSASTSGVLHAVGVAHMDTQWQWTLQDTISEDIPRTLRDNFALFRKYPDYRFSFDGAWRYMLAKEYYPEDFAELKKWVASGNWHPAGAMLEGADLVVPSPESLMRQILYGNLFFEEEFGVRSRDLLSDAFGFGAAIPSIAAHCGLRGFSTQKLAWGSAVPIPFEIGRWAGPDGAEIVAALKPGSFGTRVDSDWSADPRSVDAVQSLGKSNGVFLGYRYFGTGPRGGAPNDQSLEWLAKSIAEPSGPVRIVGANSEQMFTAMTDQDRRKLPRYQGELLMSKHGNGCYTSHAEMKRWNRQNEQLADAAERMAVWASWLGLREYPQQRLRENWIRFLWNQMHDILPGTCIPRAYAFSWNDMILAQQQFAAVLTDSVAAITSNMDTRGPGVPLVIVNPLDQAREETIEATVDFSGIAPGWNAVRVLGPDGKEVPAQLLEASSGDIASGGPSSTAATNSPAPLPEVPSKPDAATRKIVFLASAPPVGCAVYHVVPFFQEPPEEGEQPEDTGEIKVTADQLENSRYSVQIDSDGNISKIFDKRLKRNLLGGPVRLELLGNVSSTWPAWEIEHRTVSTPPRSVARGITDIRIVEKGPARGVIEVRRRAGKSLFVQRIRLGAGGAGGRVEIQTQVDWQERSTLLKLAIPLASGNPLATYDQGLGVVSRGNNSDRVWEVPAQQWADVTAKSGEHGVSILTDSKYGWDKPGDAILRSTLIHTPAVPHRYSDQGVNDVGRHRMTHAILGHSGDWRTDTPGHAARLNQPMAVFQTAVHEGALGPKTSFLRLNTPKVAVRALKHMELTADERNGSTGKLESTDVVVRLQELTGRPVDGVEVALAGEILSAREINGAEEALGPVKVTAGKLVVTMKAFQPRTFAVKLSSPASQGARPMTNPIQLPYTADIVTSPGEKSPIEGVTGVPAVLWPAEIQLDSMPFRFGSASGKNALRCEGQQLALPSSEVPSELHLLAASLRSPAKVQFSVGKRPTHVKIPSMTGKIGQWDGFMTNATGSAIGKPIKAAFQPCEVGWTATHRQDADGSLEPYLFCHFYKITLSIPAGEKLVSLPRDPDVVIVAATRRSALGKLKAAAPLGDSLEFWTDDEQTAPLPAVQDARPQQGGPAAQIRAAVPSAAL